jgi:hypothetical protein
MKYRLLNEFGNRVVNTNSEREKNSFLKKGFHIDIQETKENDEITKKTEVKKSVRKVTKNNEGQNKN